MDADLADLAPLFVSEARSRLEHIATLIPRLDSDADAISEVRRELHTLKGASRMLSFAAISELCHAAETFLQGGRDRPGRGLTLVSDALARMVDAVERGEHPRQEDDVLRDLGEQPPVGEAPPVPSPSSAAAVPAAAELRLDTSVANAVTDQATRLRIAALGLGRFPTQLGELATLAERGASDGEPAQVLAVLGSSLRHAGLELEDAQCQLRRLAEAQLDALLAMQVQPLRPFLLSLARHARELARTLGKEVEVELAGGEVRLDRRIVEDLEEALLHLVRNAVDHGIEHPGARDALGKPRIGKLRIEAAAAGPRVCLRLSDDGAGIDPAAVASAAVERGFLEAKVAATLAGEEILRLLFTPGFSTRREISEVSGRGLGLDVVASGASRIGGEVTISSQTGVGTTVTVEVPATRRGERVVVVRAGTLRVALPASIVQRVQRLRARDVVERDGRHFATLGERLIPFVPLAEVANESPRDEWLLLSGTASGRPVAVTVDAVEGEEEVLVRRAGASETAGGLLDGVALLASGEPVAVLSPTGMTALRSRPTVTAERRSTQRPRLRVLLVEDSLVTREMERRLLEDAGFDVVTATDGTQAIDRLTASRFDCIVTDIEMPEMDGFELTREVRRAAHLAQLPVVVVSTHDRPEDRLRALQAGADAYLSKQRLDAMELVGVVRNLGGR